MDSLMSALDELLATQFTLAGCQCKVNRAKDHLIYYVTKKLVQNSFSQEEEDAVIDFCNELNAVLAKRPLTTNMYLTVEKLMDNIKLITGTVASEED